MSSVEDMSVQQDNAESFLILANALLDEIPVLNSKIVTSTALQESEVPNVLAEVLKFLHLIGENNQRLTPSLVVDLAWHEFILCTRNYHDYCEEHFGRYIHHHPGGDEKQNNQQFLLTHQLYKSAFGTPPEAYWGGIQKAECGICEAI